MVSGSRPKTSGSWQAARASSAMRPYVFAARRCESSLVAFAHTVPSSTKKLWALQEYGL